MLKHISSYENVGFIFDCDGLLLDPWKDMKECYEGFSGQILSDKQWLDIRRDYDLHPEKYVEWAKVWAVFALTQKFPPVQGMPELIAELASRGAEMLVLSSIRPEAEQARRENIETFYGAAFANVDCVGRKDKPLGIAVYAEWYDCTVVIDNNIMQIKHAQNITTYQIWYDDGSLSRRAHELDNSVYRADSVDALRDFLLF